GPAPCSPWARSPPSRSGVTTDAPRTPPRVVSLLPAATEIVAALGAVDQLVGVTPEGDPARAVAAVTRVTRAGSAARAGARRPRVTSSAGDRDAASARIDAEVRALVSAGAPVFGFD